MVKHIQYVKHQKNHKSGQFSEHIRKKGLLLISTVEIRKWKKKLQNKKIQHTVTNKIRKIYVYE